MRFGKRDSTEHSAVTRRFLPLLEAHLQPGFGGGNVEGALRDQGGSGSGYFRIEFPAKPVQAGLQTAAQTLARGHAHLADPAILQPAQHTAQHE